MCRTNIPTYHYRWGTNLPADIVAGTSPPIEMRLAGGRGAGIAADCFGSAKPLSIADAYADAQVHAHARPS